MAFHELVTDEVSVHPLAGCGVLVGLGAGLGDGLPVLVGLGLGELVDVPPPAEVV